ncbi:MAG: VCBS repeat-containing protein [Gemmataceae bacterium]
MASVKVYNAAGVAVAIDAYGPAWRFGAFVAVADLDGNGTAELIVSPGGGVQQVRLFNGQTGVAFNQFFPFGPGQVGPVVVGTVDLDLDGKPDILAARGRGGPSVVRLFNGRTLGILKAFPAFPGSLDGVFLAGV